MERAGGGGKSCGEGRDGPNFGEPPRGRQGEPWGETWQAGGALGVLSRGGVGWGSAPLQLSPSCPLLVPPPGPSPVPPAGPPEGPSSSSSFPLFLHPGTGTVTETLNHHPRATSPHRGAGVRATVGAGRPFPPPPAPLPWARGEEGDEEEKREKSKEKRRKRRTGGQYFKLKLKLSPPSVGAGVRATVGAGRPLLPAGGPRGSLSPPPPQGGPGSHQGNSVPRGGG